MSSTEVRSLGSVSVAIEPASTDTKINMEDEKVVIARRPVSGLLSSLNLRSIYNTNSNETAGKDGERKTEPKFSNKFNIKNKVTPEVDANNNDNEGDNKINTDHDLNCVTRPFFNSGNSCTEVSPKLWIRMMDYVDTTLEILWAILYAIYGIFVALILALIPRRFRYKDISGQVVLITGAGSGIGRLMAKTFALKHGAVIVAWDINEKGNDETVKFIKGKGAKCFGYVVDVSSRESIRQAAAKVKVEVGKVDILINNAGIVSGKDLLSIPDEKIEKTFQVNVISNFWTIKEFLPEMLKTNKGHVVTIASSAGLVGISKLVDYCSSKYAAVGLSEALMAELRSNPSYNNVHTTTICPYYINTGMFDGVVSKLVPILRPEPVVEDIVAAVLTNQEQIVLPRFVYILILLKMILPGEVGRRVSKSLGIATAMSDFKGRL